MTLQGYYNRFQPSQNFDELLFRASKGLQSAELNEIQSVINDRLVNIADALFSDGAVIRDCDIIVDAATGAVKVSSGALYVAGAVREIAARNDMTISTSGSVEVGVYVAVQEVTELEDSTLRDPAVGTRNYNEPGAGRKKVELSWGFSGDGGDAASFYPVFSILNGYLLDVSDPPVLDSAQQLVARYDREANGNYIVDGLGVTHSILDGIEHTLMVQAGVANVNGIKIDKVSSQPFVYNEDPDLQQISNEPETSSSAGTQTITTTYQPLESIQDVVITTETTETVTHGAFSGASDALANTSVLSITSIVSGGTTYASPADFTLNGDQVDWSPSGNEPSPGATYTVVYRHLVSVTPTNIDLAAGTFDITGAVVSTLVLIDYRWKLPRFDLLVMGNDGVVGRQKGISHRFDPQIPDGALDATVLAVLDNKWGEATGVDQSEMVFAVPFGKIGELQKSIGELYELVALERLERDISSKVPTTKNGVFVDPFLDDDLRDSGYVSGPTGNNIPGGDATIVDGELVLPISGTSIPFPTNNGQDEITIPEYTVPVNTLPYNRVSILSQPLRTGSMKINPYQAFEPMAGSARIHPAQDTIVRTTWRRKTRTFYSNPHRRFKRNGRVRPSKVTSTVRTLETVETKWDLDRLRERDVRFRIFGFRPGEQLTKVEFAGKEYANRLYTWANPKTAQTYSDFTANLNSAQTRTEFRGRFRIPGPDIYPVGTYEIEFTGEVGPNGEPATVAVGTYTGADHIINRRHTYVTTRVKKYYDPLAQTFVLDEPRMVTGVKVRFAAKDTEEHPVLIQLRTVENGVPTLEVLADARIEHADITTDGNYNEAVFTAPFYCDAEREYALVFLSDSADHALWTAKLGQFDTFSQTWVTEQPYNVGVLLSSSNAATWTPHQKKDLNFELMVAEFTANQSTVDLGQVNVTDATDLIAEIPCLLPGDDSNITLRLSASNGDVIDLAAGGQEILTQDTTTTYTAQAVLNGNSKIGPIMFPGAELLVGNLFDAADYRTRAITAQGGGSIKVYFDAEIPGSASVTPTFKDGATFSAMSLSSSTPIGDNLVEYEYTGTLAANDTQVQLDLAGSPAYRPYVRNLRVVIS